MKLYLDDFNELMYDSDLSSHHIDAAGTSEFKVDFKYKNMSVWYRELNLSNFKIGFGSGCFKEKTSISFDFEEESVEMHFALKGNSITSFNKLSFELSMNTNSHNIYYGSGSRGKLDWLSEDMFFFEINLSPSFFEQYLPSSKQFDQFKTLMQRQENASLSSHNHPITAEMHSIISSIMNCTLKNKLRKLFLDAKVLDLLLLQLHQMQHCEYCLTSSDLSKNIIDKMYLARDIVVDKLSNPLSLSELSTMVNTNECTLKKEFKNIFGKTVFGFIRDAKMEKAKNMLLHQSLSISEISDIIGYKNPQHFSTAFKRKYGMRPSEIKN